MAAKLPDSEFAQRTRAGNRRRSERRLDRLRQSGKQQLLVWIPVELRREIDRLAGEQGKTVTDISTVILHAGIAALTASTEPTPATPRQIAGKASDEKPTDRASLASIAHQMRQDGMAIAAIAAEFNRRDWTPNTIPKQPGTRPRSDAASEWTVKSLSQLMNRDHPTVSL